MPVEIPWQEAATRGIAVDGRDAVFKTNAGSLAILLFLCIPMGPGSGSCLNRPPEPANIAVENSRWHDRTLSAFSVGHHASS